MSSAIEAVFADIFKKILKKFTNFTKNTSGG